MTIAMEISLLAGRTLRRQLRTPAMLVGSLALPVALFALMSVMFGDLVGDYAQGDYVDRLGPAIVLSAVGFGASVTGMGLFADLRGGLLDRLRTMSVSGASLLAGRLLADLVRVLAVSAAVVLVAVAAGFRFAAGVPAAAGFFGVVLVFGVMFTSVAMLVALLCPTEAVVENVLDPPAIMLFFLSSGFVPVSAFPGGLQPVVRANPMSCGVNALMGLSGGGPVLVPVLQTLAWTAGVSAVCGGIALRRYRRITPGR